MNQNSYTRDFRSQLKAVDIQKLPVDALDRRRRALDLRIQALVAKAKADAEAEAIAEAEAQKAAVEKQIKMVLTAGPGLRVKCFDRAIASLDAKRQLAEFIVVQEKLGRFIRPSVNPVSLSRTVLKHARKRVRREEIRLGDVVRRLQRLRTSGWNDCATLAEMEQLEDKLLSPESVPLAITRAGIDILSIYMAPRHRKTVCDGVIHAVNQLAVSFPMSFIPMNSPARKVT